MTYSGQNDQSGGLPSPYPAFQLTQHILIDFEAYEYEVRGMRVPMTRREWQLLYPLVEKFRASPRGYLRVQFLAEQIMPRETDYFDPEQIIAQTASNIRRKWGEPCRCPRLLICNRGIGYQLRPEPGYGYPVAGLTHSQI